MNGECFFHLFMNIKEKDTIFGKKTEWYLEQHI